MRKSVTVLRINLLVKKWIDQRAHTHADICLIVSY